ncbi:hypothetical protein DL767_010836 [Monosporascus sp. MG133]|nr:hypothetical protein DL767_010836 [Monosporascus sp. MG133]
MLVLRWGADPLARDRAGRTAEGYARENGDRETASFLAKMKWRQNAKKNQKTKKSQPGGCQASVAQDSIGRYGNDSTRKLT